MSEEPRRFQIFKGELSDAPGRWEEWTEYLTDLGADCWELEVIDNDHASGEEIPPIREQYSTVDLVEWLRDRDGADQDNDRISNHPRTMVGERLKALERYAKSAGLGHLVTIINRVRRNNWPPKPRAPRVLKVSRVTEFSRPPSGRGPKDKFLVVETENGPGIMSIPLPGERSSMYWLGTNRYHRISWKCTLRKELVQQIESLISPKLKGIDISFLIVVFLVKSLVSKFPGGLEGFDKKYEGARMTDDLRGLAFMGSSELDGFIVELGVQGIEAGVDFAVGEMFHGEWVPCRGVRFVGRGDFPKNWVAIHDLG